MEKYKVEALYEPNGEGSGWECTDNDGQATFFGVCSAVEFDGYLDGADTREEAQAIADELG